jgi:predicted GNAT family acetyltransferase
VESQTQIITKESFLTPINGARTVTGTFIPEEGVCRLGFHLVTDWKDHATFDNVYVQVYGSSAIPAEATNVSAQKGKGNVAITATMPRLTAKGDVLSSITKVEVIRDGSDRACATLESAEPGATVTLYDENPVLGVNKYTIYVYNESGKGLPTTASVDVRPDTPKAVENLNVVADNNGQEAVITWNYPADGLGVNGEALDPEDITYTISYTVNYQTYELAKVSGTVNSYRDVNVAQYFSDSQQAKVKYTVVPSTLKGSGTAQSVEEVFGRSYELPFVCSFEDNSIAPWEGSSWAVGAAAYDPQTTAQDGYNVASYIAPGSSELISPRINLTGLVNPHLTFYLYQDDQSTANNSYIQVGLRNAAEGAAAQTQYISDVIRVKASAAGWQLYDIDLSAYSTWSRASLVFLAVSSNSKSRIHIDNVNISGERPDYDVKAVSLSGPAIARMGYDNIYTTTIENVGMHDYDSFKVELLRNNEVIDETTMALTSGNKVEVPMTFHPALTEEPGETWLTLHVTAANDVNSADDETMCKVTVLYPNLPYVNDLQGSGKGDAVELQWSDASAYPNDISVTEDFDSYDRFATSNVGDWTLVDEDGAATIAGISNSSTSQTITWDNAGTAQAYIVFDPVYLGITSLCTAYSGNQCMVSFCSAEKNDDWLISPQLSGGAQTVTFYARAMNSSYANEKLEFRYSMAGKDTEDFKLVKRETVSSETWTKYSFEVPAGARYFAIRCISNNQFALMIDDVTYDPAQEVVEFTGYNVYRDGEKIASEIGDASYRDTDIHSATAKHTYFVSAQYEEGESAYSNQVTIDVSGISTDNISGEIAIYTRNHELYIQGAAGNQVMVCNAAGQVFYQFMAKANIESLSLQPGIYIVRAGNKTAKIAVN